MSEQKILVGIERELEALPGHVGFYYKSLVTGKEYGVREEEIYSAASVIKFPLFLHILAECEQGRMSLDDEIVTEEEDKVSGLRGDQPFYGQGQDRSAHPLPSDDLHQRQHRHQPPHPPLRI